MQPSLARTRAEEPRPETVEAVTEEVAVRIEAGEARVVVKAEDPDMSLTHQIVVATAITGMVLLLGTVSSPCPAPGSPRWQPSHEPTTSLGRIV